MSSESNQQIVDRRTIGNLKHQMGSLVLEKLSDPTVIEIMLNPGGELWVEHFGEPMRSFGHMGRIQAESLIRAVASMIGDSITARNPILECEFPLDGSRFEALFPPVVSGPTFTIRKKAIRVFSLHEYLMQGIMSARSLEAIQDAVEAKQNILIIGGTGTGKTTLTNAVIRYMVDACPHDRLAILEDTMELQCTAKNAVLMRSVEHADMTRLLKATMRLRPDRIIVGEVRDGAALALLKAWNTGHPGGVATIHANNAEAGLDRMEQLVAEATQAPMQRLIAEAVDLIVSIEKCAGSRRVNEILRVNGYENGGYKTEAIGG